MHMVRALAALFLLVTAAASSAMACSCRRDMTAESLVSTSDAVFTGTVISTRAAGSRNRAITSFRVTESFKGPPVGATIVVNHRSGPSPACGVNFAVGDSVAMGVGKDEGTSEFVGSLCSVVGFNPVTLESLRALPPK